MAHYKEEKIKRAMIVEIRYCDDNYGDRTEVVAFRNEHDGTARISSFYAIGDITSSHSVGEWVEIVYSEVTNIASLGTTPWISKIKNIN